MKPPASFLVIKGTGKKAPLFPEISNEILTQVYKIADNGNAGAAAEKIKQLTNCSDLEAKLFIGYREQIRKHRKMSLGDRKWVNGDAD